MSSNWSKTTDLSFPLTARGLEDINAMFQKLFSKLPLNVNRGGTGLGFGDVNIGDILYGDRDASDDPILSALPSVAPGSYLRSGGILTAPLWSTVTLPNTAAIGDIWITSALNTITGLAIGAAGTVIRSNGTIPANSAFTIPNTFAQGDVVYASATNVLSGLPKSAVSTQYLANTGASNSPVWDEVSLTTGVSDVLPEANGGTGQGTWVAGNIVYASATNNLGGLAIGANGAYLRSNGSIPFWSTLTIPNTAVAGGVFYASATSVGAFLAIGGAGTVIRSTGTLPAYSTFTIPNTFALGDTLYASATNVLTALAGNITTVQQVLAQTGNGSVSAAPSWVSVASLTDGFKALFDHFVDVTVGGAEADIYTNTLAANTFIANGSKVIAEYGGHFVTVGTELTQLKVYLAGTAIWDSTGLAPATGTTSWRVYAELIRVSSTVVRYTVSLNTTGASGYVYAVVGELTGLTLSGTNILKITGTSSGVGSGAGDIVGKMGYVEFQPAA